MKNTMNMKKDFHHEAPEDHEGGWTRGKRPGGGWETNLETFVPFVSFVVEGFLHVLHRLHVFM